MLHSVYNMHSNYLDIDINSTILQDIEVKNMLDYINKQTISNNTLKQMEYMIHKQQVTDQFIGEEDKSASDIQDVPTDKPVFKEGE